MLLMLTGCLAFGFARMARWRGSMPPPQRSKAQPLLRTVRVCARREPPERQRRGQL